MANFGKTAAPTPAIGREGGTNKLLADTFRLIAQQGADCFYKVDLAKGCNIAQSSAARSVW